MWPPKLLAHIEFGVISHPLSAVSYNILCIFHHCVLPTAQYRLVFSERVRSRSLYAIARPFAYLSSVICNARTLY